MDSLISSAKFQNLMRKHIKEMIELLFEMGVEFNIITETKNCRFSPPLPKSILDAIGDVAMFAISNYSFESAKIEGDNFYFEGGFGAENFGSVVEIPLLGIKFILLGQEAILINLATLKEIEDEDDIPAFLKKPENQELLKKRGIK